MGAAQEGTAHADAGGDAEDANGEAGCEAVGADAVGGVGGEAKAEVGCEVDDEGGCAGQLTWSVGAGAAGVEVVGPG